MTTVRLVGIVLCTLVLAACGPRHLVAPAVQSPEEVYDNHSQASFVARGSVEAVLDSLVAELQTRECLTVRRGRDASGTAALALDDPCPGQSNRAVVRVVDGGDGTVRGTVEAVYSGASTNRSLAVLPAGALFHRNVPVFVVPITEPGQPACSTLDAWHAETGAPPRPDLPRDTTVAETPPELVGGLDGFSRSVRYPDTARRDGVQGLTFARFVVDETGAVTCAELTVSLRPDLDAEALRAVREARLTPGTQDGRAVKVRMAIPINFRIRY
ncbi:MAG TPA: energy transducer TonB [Rubricoccaceae bacterium]|jgi:protein TonB